MKSTLIDISKKIDKSYVDVIREINKATDLLSIPFFIIGAMARDFIMEYFYSIGVTRMTNDIDIGIRVASWKKFDDLVDALIKTGKFIKLQEKQRLQCGNIFIDILPFGGIADKDFKIIWPPEHDVAMSVVGFEEVFKYSTTVRLIKNPDLRVKIPTLPGLAVLKLLSWKDAYPDRQRDAEDLLFIMINYKHAGIFNRLYESELRLMEEENFDNRMAAIKLLGKDMKALCNKNTLEQIREILDEETDEESNFNLVLQMMHANMQYNFENILNLLKKLKEGIKD
jgi:predicted nucleotidyltransferase